MTDPRHFSILLIIDCSASVQPFCDAMLGGLWNVLAEEADAPGLTTMTVVQFNDDIEITSSMQDPENVKLDLNPRGNAALHDAIGFGVLHVRRAISELPAHARPWGVQVVVVTNGIENASQKFSLEMVQQLVHHQRRKHGWQFTMLAANQDSNLTGAQLGFDEDGAERATYNV